MFRMDNLYEALGNLTLFNIFIAFSIAFYLITFILSMIALCKIFAKASKPDIFAFVPFLNLWLWFEICGIRGFWSLIPGANIILLIISLFKFPVRFGCKPIYGLGILFIPYLFLMYMAFNKNLNYIPPVFKDKKKEREKKENKPKKKSKKEEIEILDLNDYSENKPEVLELEGEIVEILSEEDLKK